MGQCTSVVLGPPSCTPGGGGNPTEVTTRCLPQLASSDPADVILAAEVLGKLEVGDHLLRAIAPLLEALRAHLADPAAAFSLCHALAHASRREDLRAKMVRHDALALLPEALDAHPGDAFVAQHACCALDHLTRTSAAHREAALGGDALAALVRALGANLGTPAVVEAASLALCALAPTDGAQAAQPPLSPAQAAVLVAALETSIAAPAAATPAAWALLRLSISHRDKRPCLMADPIPTLIKVMLVNPGRPSLCSALARALRSLALYEGGRLTLPELVEGGAARALTSALWRNLATPETAGPCALALRTLCSGSAAGRAACLAAGAEKALASLLHEQLGDEGLAERACAALAALACGSEGGGSGGGGGGQPQAALLRAGVLPLLDSALLLHSASASVCLAASAALAGLATGRRRGGAPSEEVQLAFAGLEGLQQALAAASALHGGAVRANAALVAEALGVQGVGVSVDGGEDGRSLESVGVGARGTSPLAGSGGGGSAQRQRAGSSPHSAGGPSPPKL